MLKNETNFHPGACRLFYKNDVHSKTDTSVDNCYLLCYEINSENDFSKYSSLQTYLELGTPINKSIRLESVLFSKF